MLKNITLGQYFPGDSVVHRLDPRTKIWMTIGLILAVFCVSSFTGYAIVLAYIVLAASITGIGMRFLVRGVKPILAIVIITFALNTFFTSTGNTLWQWNFIRVTDVGLKNAAFMAIRLMLLVLGTQILTLTTSPIALTDGLERMMRPLAKIHFPAHELAMLMSIALRFVPTLLEEADKTMRAQMARGADFESGNLLRRARAMVPLMVPLFVSAFRRADELALAMEARCYRGGTGRTRMKVLKYARIDLMAFLPLAALIACVVLVRGLI